MEKTALKTATKSSDYTLVIKMGNEVVEVSAPSIPEALSKMNLKEFSDFPEVTIKRGALSHTFESLNPRVIRLALDEPAAREMFEQRAKIMLGEIN